MIKLIYVSCASTGQEGWTRIRRGVLDTLAIYTYTYIYVLYIRKYGRQPDPHASSRKWVATTFKIGCAGWDPMAAEFGHGWR